MYNSKKGAIELEMLAYWAIGILILIIGLVAYFLLSGKGQGAIDYLKTILRFGR